MANMAQPQVHEVSSKTVLIAGGGPVGLLTATVLAFYGVKSIIFERNETTTRWPKMDITNVRSMEFFHRLGLADSLRAQGVPSDIPYTVIFSQGLGRDKVMAKWDLPSVDAFRRTIRENNDGSQPLEPYQRLSQAVFEAWMKGLCEKNPLIDLRFGWKVESVAESADGVEATITDIATGTTDVFKGKYWVGCDGASSRTRRSLEIPLDGGPVPLKFLLVHFKSNDLANLRRQGRFWHLFFLRHDKFHGALISQNEKDIFTVHLGLSPDADESVFSSEEAVYTVLGGQDGPFPIKIDSVLVRSSYRPSIAVARSFAGPHLRVFLAGDSAHQNIPTGGYGMNTGIGDAFDIGWKLAEVINGHAHREGLLSSYEAERRPVSITNVERSGQHMAVHMQAVEIIGGHESGAKGDENTEGAATLREMVDRHYQSNDSEDKDFGVEMGYRCRSGVIIPDDDDDDSPAPPVWEPHRYNPTTFPGSRAPHVYLKDGSALFDRLGPVYSLVEFAGTKGADEDRGSGLLREFADSIGVLLKPVRLVGEDHAAKLWEKPLVLVRPDCHVAWRGMAVKDKAHAARIMETVTGCRWEKVAAQAAETGHGDQPYSNKAPERFTSTQETFTQVENYELEGMGDMQK